MKKIISYTPTEIKYIMIILSMILLCSCSSYYFSEPQPVDSENLYEFPKSFRGVYAWNGDTLQFAKTYVKSVTPNIIKVVNGMYVNPVDTMRFFEMKDTAIYKQYNKPHESLQTVKFDSLNNPIDTLLNYLVKGNKIYPIYPDGMLGQGEPFTLKHDTIQFTRGIDFRLGETAVLRKVSSKRYVLNTRNSTGWWMIYILEKYPDGKIRILENLDIKESNAAYHVQGGDYYFDVRWTKNDLLKFTEGEDFEELVPLKK